jgi:hypothetical protein
MWPNALTQLLEARFIALVAIVLFAGLAWLKREAISTLSLAAWHKLSDWFWKSAEEKLATHRERDHIAPHQSGAYLNTYRGIFESYNQFESAPHSYFFRLLEGDHSVTISIAQTNLFSHVHVGARVEVTTRVGVFYDMEVVIRVRAQR